MPLQEKARYFIEVTEDDAVQVRKARIIYDDVTGESVTDTLYHRHVLLPGLDYSGEHPKVKAVCDSVFTPATVAMHEARRNLITKESAKVNAKAATAKVATSENEVLEAQAEA